MVTWRKRHFDSVVGVTEYPAGPNLSALAAVGKQIIYVTSPGFDDIGKVLSMISVDYETFDGRYDCDLLFLNCGTQDTVDHRSLTDFVERGGCLYASDLTSALISLAFPHCFQFGGKGSSGDVQAEIVDDELKSVIGEKVAISFDMASWSVLKSSSGTTLVRAAQGTPYAGNPLMVEIDVGRGAVFYTCFHNKAQSSASETNLLKLLVLKQIGASTHTSIAQVGHALGVNLAMLRTRKNRSRPPAPPT